MTCLLLIDELVVIVRLPVAAPALVGSNRMFSVAVWPCFNVAGMVTPDMVKPVPVRVVALIVTGAVPVEVKVTDCVAGVFSVTLPKATFVALMLSAGTEAFSCRAKVLVTEPALAVSVTASVAVTDAPVAVKLALVPPAGIVTVAGRVTAALLLDRLTFRPPLGAAALKATEQASVTAPVREAFPQES